MNHRHLLLALAFIAFIALGLPDALLGIAWPFMREQLNQPLAASGYLVMATTIGAALSGVVSAWAGRTLGVGRLLALSCCLTGLGLLGYSVLPSIWLMVVCAVVIGIAAGATDATVNGFVARNFSNRLMQWLHASFGIGITLGPVAMTVILAQQGPWQLGYQFHSVLQFTLAALFLTTAGLWLVKLELDDKSPDQTPSPSSDVTPAQMRESLKQWPVWLGLAMFFCYCGLEFSVGLWSFSLLSDVRGLSTAQAGAWVSLYWAMFTVGRIVMGLISKQLTPQRMIKIGFVASVVGTLLFALFEQIWLNLIALVLLGLAYAPIYPALMSTTLKRVGRRHFDNAMGLQVSGASLGIMLIPTAIGFIAAETSLSAYPWLLLAVTLMLMLIYFASTQLTVQETDAN